MKERALSIKGRQQRGLSVPLFSALPCIERYVSSAYLALSFCIFHTREGETLFADMVNCGDDDEYCPRKLYEEAILYENLTSALLMTEIQLKNIVDRMGADPDTKTDGDETTVKDGIRISKFPKEAMEIGEDVKASMKETIFGIFNRNVGNDAVFPTIRDHPYSYELLPEYERGEKKLPNTRP